MKSTREELEPWLDGYIRKRYPELEPAMLAAIDAFDAIQRQKRATPELLSPIVEAASSSRVPLCETAAGFLAQLTGRFDAAREAVAGMAASPQSQVRFSAILCLGAYTPRPLTLRLLRQGLRDQSARVRGKAADWALRLLRRELVPDLERAAAEEPNANARETIEFSLKLLRDGYVLSAVSEDTVSIAALTRRGAISLEHVPKAGLDERKIRAVVARIGRK